MSGISCACGWAPSTSDRFGTSIGKRLRKSSRKTPKSSSPCTRDWTRETDAALRQFGFHTYEDDLKLQDIENRWLEDDDSNESEWIDELHDAIRRAACNGQPAPVARSFKSVRTQTDWHFVPAVTRVRGFPDDSREFDVYLIRVDQALATRSSSRKRAPATKRKPVARRRTKKQQSADD